MTRTPDWADDTAANLLDAHAVMQGSLVLVLRADFEAALASQLRIARTAGEINAVVRAELAVRRTYERAAS